MLFAPDPGGPEVSLPGLDKAVHVALFALLTGTAAARFGRRRAVATGLVGYALGSEIAQGLLLADRSGDPRDVLADLTGVAAAWAVHRWLDTRAGGGSAHPVADPQS